MKKIIYLAFDISDTKKIIENCKNKKINILAITPNAYEILKKNKYKNLKTPLETNSYIHEYLASDNIFLKDKINLMLNNKNNNFSFCDESFINIFVQAFSSVNFFFKILNKNCFYCSYLSGNLKTYDFNGIYNLLVRKIIEEKYGIFKISTSKHQSFYFLKKIINDIKFFFLKKTVILKSLGNEKKLNNSNNIIEISFGQMSNFNHKNFFLIIKSFFYFIFYNKNVKIYPEFKFKENLNLKKKLQKFLLKFNIDALSILEKDFVNFFHDNVIYQNAIISFLNKRFNNFKVNYFFSDHVTWLDSFCIAKYSKTKKIKSYLCSHGMIDYNHKYNKFIKSELNSLSKGLCSSYYITSVITQTPTAYKYARNKNENVENIIKAHPFAYNGQRKKKVTVNQKKINILFAGTYKVFLSRPYIYQGSFEFISSIKKIVKIFSGYSNVNLIFNIRKNDEIENLLYRELFGNFKNINFYFNKNIEILMQDCDLLITNFSTLVDEFAYLRKPIIIFNEFMKYECYKKIYKNNNKKKNKLLPIYYYNEKQLKNNIREILVMIRRGFKTSLPLHIWDNTKAIDNQNLLKKINVFK